MSVIQSEIRSGAYYDSVVLMQLQKALAGLPAVLDAGVVMATPANKEVLEASDLLTAAGERAGNDDLLIVVKAESAETALSALAQVDELIKQRRSGGETRGFRPKSLATAVKMLPEAEWVLISVPGRFAAAVADQALNFGKNVFLYSDNVTLADEVRLKQKAHHKGLLVMGPDCGTAIINGVGLGFANRVAQGNIGIVAASGTGLQAISSAIHQRGFGISQAIGTGGRDLKDDVQGITMLQGIEWLARDDETETIIVLSKPPSKQVAEKVLEGVRLAGKPSVVYFMGQAPLRQAQDEADHNTVQFAYSFAEVVDLGINSVPDKTDEQAVIQPKGFVRGLFSGGTLAFEAVNYAHKLLSPLYTNTVIGSARPIADPLQSEQHTIIDLGDDIFTQGRLHPMMDNDLRLRRLREEASDPDVSIILFDIVLGDGAHPDPASEFAPVISAIKAEVSAKAERDPIFIAIIIGTDQDPQGWERQIDQLLAVGVHFTDSVAGAIDVIEEAYSIGLPLPVPATPLSSRPAFAAINVGLETFYDSLIEQGAQAIHVEWRPPAAGNEKMMALLQRLKQSNQQPATSN